MVYRFLTLLLDTVPFVVLLPLSTGAELVVVDGSEVVVVVGVVVGVVVVSVPLDEPPVAMVAVGAEVVVVSVPFDAPVVVVTGALVAMVEGDVAVVVEDELLGEETATSLGVAPGVVETATKAPHPLMALVSRLMVLVPLVPQAE